MGLEINTLITLESGEKYKILNETLFQGKKYFLASSEILGDSTNNEIVLEEVLEGLDIYVKKVNNTDLLAQLFDLLKTQN